MKISNIRTNSITKPCFKSASSLISTREKIISDMITMEINLNNLKQQKAKLTNQLLQVEWFSELEKSIGNIIKGLFSAGVKPLDINFPGYSKAVNLIRTLFIEKINKSNNYEKFDVHPALLLCGQKSSTIPFVKAAIKEINPQRIVIKARKIENNFYSDLQNMLEEAKENYFRTGRHTAIFLDEPERFIATNMAEAEGLGINLDAEDREILNNSQSDMSKVSYFKALLDEVSKSPEKNKNNEFRSAATFIMASENPHLIHQDLLKRQGKLTALNLGIPMNDILQEMIIDIAKFKIPTILLDGFPWNKLIKTLNPSSSNGGLSIVNIRQALEKSLTLPEFISAIISQKRDISPSVCSRFMHINRIMDFGNSKKDNNSIEMLLLQRKMGLLSNAKKQELFKEIAKLKNELEEIKSISLQKDLSEEQQNRLKMITEILNKI